MRYTIGDMVTITEDYDLLDENNLPHDFAGNIEEITDIDDGMYIIENEEGEEWEILETLIITKQSWRDRYGN